MPISLSLFHRANKFSELNAEKFPSPTRHAQDKPLWLQLRYARYECYMQLLPTKYLLANDFLDHT